MESNLTVVAAIPLSDLFLLRGQVFNSDSNDGVLHLEQDFEETTKHLGVFLQGKLIAGGSLVHQPIEGEPAFRIRAVAVSPDYQGKGYGRLLIEALLNEACCANEPRVVWLSSLINQVAFYSKLGFIPVGEPYLRPVDGWSQIMKASLI